MIVPNLLLAIAWMVLNNSFTPADLAVGLIFGFVVLRLSWPVLSSEPFTPGRYFRFLTAQPLRTTLRWIGFLGFGFVEIVKSNVAVTKAVLSPKLDLKPGIVAIPLELKSDEGITTLANLITLTPGTVTLDVSSDRKTLYIHAFDASDPDAIRRDTRESFERRVKELWP
jgi:multicomponent Na+:H+ antiporter subunit E